MRHFPEVQAALQEMPLRQMPLRRDGPQVGADEWREARQVQELLQEEGRAGENYRRYYFVNSVNLKNVKCKIRQDTEHYLELL